VLAGARFEVVARAVQRVADHSTCARRLGFFLVGRPPTRDCLDPDVAGEKPVWLDPAKASATVMCTVAGKHSYSAMRA
jgi:hypothetical protein